jgi:threonine dehydrogenase-like Zn-dependent dehydrogenase
MGCPHQEWAFPWPVKYGYSLVGDSDQGVVFALHPHQEVAGVQAGFWVPVPSHVPASRAVLGANMETAVNAVWDARPGPGDRIAVVGAGVVGCLVGWLCGRIPGTRVQLVDVADRSRAAKALGVGFSRPDEALAECDLVVHTSGTGAGLTTALALAGEEATVLELSWYAEPVAAPLGGAFHPRRLRLVSSQVGTVPDYRRSRWTHARRLELAVSLLEPCHDVLIDSESSFEALPSLLGALPGQFCHRIHY